MTDQSLDELGPVDYIVVEFRLIHVTAWGALLYASLDSGQQHCSRLR